MEGLGLRQEGRHPEITDAGSGNEGDQDEGHHDLLAPGKEKHPVTIIQRENHASSRHTPLFLSFADEASLAPRISSLVSIFSVLAFSLHPFFPYHPLASTASR